MVPPLRFFGPYVLRRVLPQDGSYPQSESWERLVPVPTCVLGHREKATDLLRLLPSAVPLMTDLAAEPVHLPEPVRSVPDLGEYKDLAGCWWERSDFQTFFRDLPGECPGSVIREKALWAQETRVGLARETASRQVKDSALYMAGHTRVADRVALAVRVTGVSADLLNALKTRNGDLGTVPMGGEHRSVWMHQLSRRLAMTLAPFRMWGDGLSVDDERIVAVALTPVVVDRPALVRPGGLCADGLRIVSLSSGKPVPLGGWVGGDHRPRAQKPVLPAGTTWHLRRDGTTSDLPDAVGKLTQWGFGELFFAPEAVRRGRGGRMTNLLVGMLAETFVHPGIGQNEGAIDLPVAREAITGYPYIPGSSMKGAWRTAFEDAGNASVDDMFGAPHRRERGTALR